MRLCFVVSAVLLISTVAAADEFADAAAAFERGEFSSAETILHVILKTNPNDPAALGLLGAVLDSEKKYTDADEVYKRAIRLAPGSATLLNNYANHQFATGDLAGAKTTYLKAIALDPSRANANLQLAAIAIEQKKGAEALRYLDHLKSGVRSSPEVEILDIQALFLAGRTAEANALVARVSAGNDPRLHFSAGLALASAGKYDDAERVFSRALEEAPANPDVLYNLGLAAFHAGHLERAREVLQTALAQRPHDVDTLYNLAQVDIDLKQDETALSLLAEAARLDPARANIQLSIAQTTRELGYYLDSLLAYDKYLQLSPRDDAARREREFMVAAAGDVQKGLAGLQDFVRSHPRDKTAHYELGIVETLSDPADALANLNIAVGLDPDFVPARFGRGLLNLLQGKPADALPDLQFAAAHTPGNPTVLDRLGETYLALDRANEAVQVLGKAAAIAPGDSRVLLHLGRAYSKAGQTEQARATLARFRAVGPDQGNRIPAAGFVEFLGLPPAQQQARYREQVRNRLNQNPQDADANLRYLKLLIDDGKTEEVPPVAAHLLSLKPPAALAAQAGRALVDAEQYAGAKPLLEYAAASAPTPEIQLDLAMATFHTAGVQPGLAQLQQVPEAQRSGDYYLAQAQMLDAAGKPNDAFAALERALHAAPTRADLYEQAALFLARQQRAAEAVRLLDQASRTIPENPRILLVKAAMLAAVPRTDEAEQLLKHIQSRWPEWAPSYVTYGILLEGEKRAREAKTQLETAMQLGASSPEAFLYLARATLDATPDRIDDAATAIKQAVALAPNDAQVQALAGRIDYQKHDYNAAVQHLQEAIRLRPNYLQARFTLAQAYRALGRKEDAARESQQFQRLRQQNPNTGDDPLDAGKPHGASH